LVFGESTTGPQNDLEHATRLARQMVTQWGMSDRLGPRTFGRKEELVFLGREISEQRNYSEKVAEEIDEEVRQIIDKAYQTAKKLLTDNRNRLNSIVTVLLEQETIEGDPLTALLSGKTPGDSGSGAKPEEPTAPKESGEPKKGVTQPKPGLAWEPQSRLENPSGG
jgi:cell division protease FtsH